MASNAPTRSNDRRFVQLSTAEEIFDIDVKTWRRRIADGTITGYRAGKRLILVDVDEIEEKLLYRIPSAGDAVPQPVDQGHRAATRRPGSTT